MWMGKSSALCGILCCIVAFGQHQNNYQRRLGSGSGVLYATAYQYPYCHHMSPTRIQKTRNFSSTAVPHTASGSIKRTTSSLMSASAPLSLFQSPVTPTTVSLLKGTLLRKAVISKKVSSTFTLLRGGAAAAATGAAATGYAPPLGTWIGPALACALSYALYNLSIKRSSATMDPILGGVLLQFVAAIVGTMLLLYQRFFVVSTSGTTLFRCTKVGLVWAVAAGLSVGAAELLSFVVSGMGVPATQSIPIIIGGSILIGTILGSVWLKESLSSTGWFGVLLIAIGITLVGMNQ